MIGDHESAVTTGVDAARGPRLGQPVLFVVLPGPDLVHLETGPSRQLVVIGVADLVGL